MSQLDVNTPKGQETVRQEERAVEILKHRFAGLEYIPTPKRRAADIDGIIRNKDGNLWAVAECKCRPNLSLEKFEGQFASEWLITKDKLDRCARVADALCVHFAGMLYLVDEDVLLFRRLYRWQKGWVVNIRTAVTETQATVNGGRARRLNAFVDMSAAGRLLPPVPGESPGTHELSE